MKMKTYAFATALAGAAMYCACTTESLADIVPPGSATYPGVTLTQPGFAFGDSSAGSTLSDKWYFNFASPTFIATADASNSDGAYSGFTLSLVNANTSAVVATGNTASGPKEDSGLGPLTLAPGYYYLQLVGTEIGSFETEVISGNINVQAVPLPGGLPLFATGLGMLGLLAARRKKNSAKV
jgi:hypothetical protein